MDDDSHFMRLMDTVGLIARHADCPSKGAVVQQCAVEIDELVDAKRITGEQKEVLLDILARAYPRSGNFLRAYGLNRAL